jgi:hypothetical protein
LTWETGSTPTFLLQIDRAAMHHRTATEQSCAAQHAEPNGSIRPGGLSLQPTATGEHRVVINVRSESSRVIVCRGGWEGDDETGSAVRVVLGADGAAVALDGSLADGQAQAGTGVAAGMGAVEVAEDRLVLAGWDADAVVGNLEVPVGVIFSPACDGAGEAGHAPS